ncbi:MAG TPA: hypothetical protein PLE30_09130 [Candidatus Kapabacteria bacterium]|nr:hypothetical protein [Candidatus Kapabacteria bacterium]
MNDRMIHDYLEGELLEEQSSMLFDELKNDPEMREELELQLKINRLIGIDSSQTNTPAELTAALFNRLNYSIPINDANKLISKRKVFFWRYAVALLLLLVLPTSYFVYQKFGNGENIFSSNSNVLSGKGANSTNQSFVDQQHKNGSNNTNNSDNSIIYGNKYNLSSKSEVNNFKNSTATNTNKSGITANANNHDAINPLDRIVSNLGNNSILSSANSKQGESITEQVIVNRSTINDMNSLFGINTHSNLNAVNIVNIEPAIASILNWLPNNNVALDIQLKNNVSSSPNNNLNYSSNIYDNLALTLWYKLNYSISLGVEVGRESFVQNFTTKDGLIYSQMPVLNYLGLGFNYTAYNLELPLETIPYCQVNAAATSIGPIVQFESGLTVAAYNKVGVKLGIEYSTLYYNVNKQIYNSGKINFVGTLVYTF